MILAWALRKDDTHTSRSVNIVYIIIFRQTYNSPQILELTLIQMSISRKDALGAVEHLLLPDSRLGTDPGRLSFVDGRSIVGTG